jgi:hypothetical protein
VLAYLFWHRPGPEAAAEGYEDAQLAFHRSLAHGRPVGMLGSALLRAPEMPWLPDPAGGTGTGTGGYEDWYLVEDFAALGVLNEAAVGRGHRTSHDRAARHVRAGAGGLYGLYERPPRDGGEGEGSAGSGGPAERLFDGVDTAVWVAREPGSAEPALGALLGDGAPAGGASLWRRRLVLGPAPEFCLLADGASAGTSPRRLPAGWHAQSVAREVLFHG